MREHFISRVVIGLLVATMFITESQAQIASITGPSVVDKDSTENYVLTYNGGITSVVWDLGVGGVEISSANTGLGELTVTVKWTSAGAKYVEAVVQGSKGSVIAGMAVTVNAPCTTLSSGSISGGDVTVCLGSARTLTLSGTSGGDGIYDYQWQSRLGTSGAFSALTGETATSYTVPSTMTDDRQYRVKVTSCSGSEIDHSAKVYVNYTETVAGTMTAASTQVCDTQTVNFQLTGSTGTIMKWRERYKDGTGAWSAWSTFEETDDISVMDRELVAWSGGQRTYEIKAMVKEGSCDTEHPKVQVIVDPVFVAGTITSSQSQSQICAAEQVTFSLSVNIGQNIEEWSSRYRDGGGAWSTFETITQSGAMTISEMLDPSGTTQNREYEIMALVGNGSCSSTSSAFLSVTGDITPAGFTAGDDITVYQNTGLISLQGSGEVPSNKVWSGTSVVNSDFDTGVASAGSNTITYTYTDPISGCEVSSTKNVVVKSSPQISSSNGTTVSLGNSIELSVASALGYDYQWTKNGSSISGANYATYSVNRAGTYAVKVIAPNTQITTSADFVITDARLEQEQNMVRTITYRVPTTNSNAVNTAEEMAESFGYYDGLGRPLQQVVSGGSPSQKDMVTVFEYDEFGRQIKDYLPYSQVASTSGSFRTDGMTEQSSFAPFNGNSKTYSEKKLEDSPIGRVLEQASPGDAWGITTGGTIKLDYGVNGSNDVRMWTLTNISGVLRSSGALQKHHHRRRW